MTSPYDLNQWLMSPAILTPNPQPQTATNEANMDNNQNTARNDFPAADYSQYGLDMDAFSSSGVTFQMPSFLAPAPGGALAAGRPNNTSTFGNINVPQQQQNQPLQNQFSAPTGFSTQPSAPQQQQAKSAEQPGQAPKAPTAPYVPDPQRPVYSPYGSSVVAVNPDLTPFSKTADVNGLKDLTGLYQPLASTSKDEFDPHAIGLPKVVGGNFPGLYSSSGFDLIGVLARVAARPYPQIDIGPVDTSCSFVVVDARKYDFPIVFASDNFTRMTGYSNAEVIGRNCRFLQSPDGQVQQGDKRKHTDGNGVFHMKTHILAGKELQTSLVNYKKDGTPFINLVTIIPITWDTDEIAYFIGFQLDLVDQPNQIISNMQAGTYTVNHTLQTGASSVIDYANDAESLAQSLLKAQQFVPKDFVTEPEVEVDPAKSALHKALVSATDGFITVLGPKGNFLYLSPAAQRYLEYESSELLGQNFSALCHPSDSAAITRELKELATAGSTSVNLLYRVKRKNSGWCWLDFSGKFQTEQGKSRKYMILVGRPRPVYSLNWGLLTAAGGLGDLECWSKVSSNGLFLYTTPSAHDILGFSASEMKGTSLFQLIAPQYEAAITQSLAQATSGKAVGLRHFLKNRRGQTVEVFTNFYPSGEPYGTLSRYPFVLLQINEYASELNRRRKTATPLLPQPDNTATRQPFSPIDMPVGSPPSAIDASQNNTARKANENIFEELETSRNSSWQFELHQLKQTNRKIKEEIERVKTARRAKRRRTDAGSTVTSGECTNCGQHMGEGEVRSAAYQTNGLCRTCASSVVPRMAMPLQGATPSTASDTSGD